ncbi:WIAG-tail domain, partial [Paenibacillus solani]|uniref:WIAG-tail domain n=1 Tax=Paenibacillus solani TaxID=1705565 RepID=UPI003D2B5EC4
GVQIAEGSIESKHLASNAFDNFTLDEGSVTGSQIAEGTITGANVAEGSLDGLQIAEGSIESRHLGPDAFNNFTLAEGSVTGGHIAEGTIERRHLSPDAFDTFTLQDGSINSIKLGNSAVTSVHISDGAVTGQQLAEAAVTAQHLAFTPVRSVAGQPKLQQFGMTPFVLTGADTQAEVTVKFDEPFAGINYVIVGMSNNPGFQISLKSQREDAAVLTVFRQPNCNLSYGFMSWIALGPSL